MNVSGPESRRAREQTAGLLGDKYRLLQRIGRGGMGDVWVAKNAATEAEVAIKTLGPTARSRVSDERLRREAKLASTVTHRNVVRIFDLIDGADGTLGLVMERLHGNTLEAALAAHGPFSTAAAIAVAVPILSALHHIHVNGIVHRDMKPANVFFSLEPDGLLVPKILDFGIAKVPAAGSALTMDGTVLGTPHYMSPEQIRGQVDIDGRSDMFSFAVVLYEMLTGVRLFHRDTAAGSLAAVLEHEADPDPLIEPKVWLALKRALSKRPYERFATCAELAETLRAAVDLGDGDLVRAILELRPHVEEHHDTTGASYEISAIASRMPPRQKSSGFMLAVGAAAAAAVVAVGVTLAVTRRDPSDLTIANPPAPTSSVVGEPSASAPSAPATASVATVTPAEPAISTPPVRTSAGKTTTPRGATKPPPATTGKRHDVATKPDF